MPSHTDWTHELCELELTAVSWLDVRIPPIVLLILRQSCIQPTRAH